LPSRFERTSLSTYSGSRSRAWRNSTRHPLGAAWDTEERRADILAFDPDGKNEKVFATGLRDNFPAEYRGDAFVTFHGSWNRGKRTGYKVVRILFKEGKPTGEYEDFITGFVISHKQVWGRPVGVAVAKDGSLFVTEDGSGTIWRVSAKK
jgi:glucose/arabinose dehydrogenase